MKKNIALFPILYLVLLFLPSCNFPSPNETEESLPVVVKVRVSAVTEYREGPGQAYHLVGMFNPGQVIEAVGRSPDGTYLLVRDPSSLTTFWWIKNEFFPLTDDLLNLPISPPPAQPNAIAATESVEMCSTPVGGGPTPVSCGTAGPPSGDGCPTPIGGGPTPISCGVINPQADNGCPTPIGGGPTPVSCEMTVPNVGSGCPTPIGGGPTPVSCGVTNPQAGSGCPTPIGGGPTLVSCSNGESSGGGNSNNPTPIGGAPNRNDNPTPLGGGSNTVPTPVK